MANIDSTQPNLTDSGQRKPNWLAIALLAAFIVAAALTAYLTFVAVRDLVVSWEITDLPGISIKETTPPVDGSEAGAVTDPQTPLQPADTGPEPVPWDGASRVTLLVMGLDYRDWVAGEGPPRTDSMILLTVDPLARTAGMLSIPRDLWVNIPGGFQYGRINTAYQLGESFNLPGGGPGLAMDTVEELLGVPIDYYAQIDFEAFIRFIDEIGGVQVEVAEKMKVDPLGDDNMKTLKPGVQVLPGDLALAYARARKTEGADFDRAQRQQQVVMGIRDRILEFNMMPTLIAKSGTLYNELSAGIHTNLTLDEVIKLAWLGTQIPEENIKKGIISPPDQVTFAVSPDGSQEVLKPITEKIRLLRDEIFTSTGPASPYAADADLGELVRAENARVQVLNGTYTAGLASTTQEYLTGQGLNVVEAGNASQLSTYTTLTFYTGKPYTVRYLKELMQIEDIRIHHFYDPNSPVDISITLGDTWANNNPMGAQAAGN